jgi:DNA polymerase III sliding clamp (beta) subunit (PCNA family)
MKFSCQLSEIITPLSNAAKFAQKGSRTADIVIIHALEDKIAFSAQNFVSGGRFHANVKSDKQGECAVNAAALQAFCAAHRMDETIEFHTTEKSAMVNIGGGKARLALGDSALVIGDKDEMPEIARIDSNLFLSLLGVSQFAETGVVDTIFSNVYLAVKDDKMFALGGNRAVFSYMWIDDVRGEEFEILLHTLFAQLAQSLIPANEVLIFRSDGKRVGVVLENDDYFYSNSVAGQYPVETIMVSGMNHKPRNEQAVSVDGDKLSVALNSVLGISRFGGDAAYRRTDISSDGESLLIESYEGNEIGKIAHEIPLQESGDPFKVIIDAQFISSVVKAIEKASKNPLLAWADEHKKSSTVYIGLGQPHQMHVWGETNSLFLIAGMK